MKGYYFWIYANIFFAFIPFAGGLLHFKRMDAALRIFWVLTALMALGECLAFYYAGKYHNNMPVYALSSWLELFMVSLYFNYSIREFRKRHTGIYIGITGLFLGILDTVFIEAPDVLNAYFLLFQAVLTIIMALYSLFQLYVTTDYIRFRSTPHFWLSLILVLFWTLVEVHWALYDYLTEHLQVYKWVVDLSIILISILTNIAITVVFIALPRQKLNHERR